MSILRASSRGALRSALHATRVSLPPPSRAGRTPARGDPLAPRRSSNAAEQQAQQLADDIKRGMEEAAPLARGTLAAEHLTRVNTSPSLSTSTAPEASASDASPPLPARHRPFRHPRWCTWTRSRCRREFRRAGFDQAQAETITRVVLAAVRASTEPLATRADLDKHVLSTRSRI